LISKKQGTSRNGDAVFVAELAWFVLALTGLLA
jgi:hypothetical protein